MTYTFSFLLTYRTKSVTVERALSTGVFGHHGDGDDGDNEDVQKESELVDVVTHQNLIWCIYGTVM